MKKILYAVIPAIAVLLIFINAFFGHMIFVSDTEQVINKYSVYVHLQSEWSSASKNIIFEVTNSWHRAESSQTVNQVLNAAAKEYNSNNLEYVNGKSYVELKHEFSDCQESWQPMLYRKTIDTVRHEIEYVQGKQLSTNPDISVYPDIDNQNYDNSKQQLKIKDGFAQFFPLCTSSANTSYEYSIKMDNRDVGFDVYFVPFIVQLENFADLGFDYYKEAGCFAQNKQSYSGSCSNVKNGSGLLVVLPDELNPWVTKITVNLYEKK